LLPKSSRGLLHGLLPCLAGLWDLSGNNRYELWAFQTTHSSNLWPPEEGTNMSDSIADLQRGFKEGVQTANEKSGCFSVAGMVVGVLLVIVLVECVAAWSLMCMIDIVHEQLGAFSGTINYVEALQLTALFIFFLTMMRVLFTKPRKG
jgi:hypothetical protein